MQLKSAEFRREREASWRELDALIHRVEGDGLKSLSAEELARLVTLYRGAVSSLSVARSISLDRNLLEYLEALTGRAYLVVYATRRSLKAAVAEFFSQTFPQTVRRFWPHLLVSFVLLALGVAVGWVSTWSNPELFHSFVDEGMAQGRGPGATREELLEVLQPAKREATDALSVFAAFLFAHNTRVGLLCFTLGFAAGLPVFFLMFTNGLMLGAFAALHQQHGLSAEFWGWILPHGITELLAIVLCGAAGLMLGQAVLFPGGLSRLDNLARRGKQAGVIVTGAAFLLFVAGGLEGMFRQLVNDTQVRYAVALLTLGIWTAYFTSAGRKS
jgi:uncharacterized membrane protein SpoIIM required for sporulation